MTGPFEGMKPIFAVALETEPRAQAAAVFDGTRLMVTHVREFRGAPQVWRDSLLENLRTKSAEGAVVMVEDRTGIFAPYATSFCFDDIVENGRTMLQLCLDRYIALDSLGYLMLDDSVIKYRITVGKDFGIADVDRDDKGRVLYNVDWAKFGGGRKALLMCVAGAMLEYPYSDRWLRTMCAAWGPPPLPPEDDPLRPFRAITIEATQQQHQRIWAERDALCLKDFHRAGRMRRQD